MHVTGNTSNGVLFTQSRQTWLQSSDVSIDIQGQLSCGINVGEAGPSVWKEIGPEPSFNASGFGSSGLCPIPLPSPSVEIISVKINSTRPSVEISPRNSSAAEGGAGQKVQLDFLSLREITPLGVIVWQAQLQEGWLMNGSMSSNSSYTSTYTSKLANNATLTYQFSTFDDLLILTLANNYTFSITPAFIKFSLRLDRWNWSSSDNKLQFQMAIDPPFATGEVRNNTPQASITTLLLHSARESDASMISRLLDFGLTNSSERVACSSMVDSTDSSLTITFDHFDTDLDYDPDISLLFGRAGHGGGDTGGAQWVIAVAVAVPVAVVLVVLITAVLLLVAYVRKQRSNTQVAVNFDGMGGDADDEL
ncbi:uncharacterized protein ACA1_023120 [Acanthamoeba castellanii str. Neff]|uniref:Uncharacterized protein n=1 Tax=Acanthamoeba castellanii (strain ATCC 30010 / Neff) TaxID=1257118 RepID=L8HE34_ACACF|nr:uncharacterized protein ACA1_023120 [Acanthamoeba castellanii str. Neff]ELR23799.1 hypothetical protein ACA1_023120 [Acanthamoeba castellanii str. Neff]